jgi:Ca-activated chloride channel family protein
MTFEDHTWLYLAPAILLLMLGLTFLGLRRKDKLLTRFVASRLIGGLVTQGSTARGLIKSTCIILSATLIALAMARPQLGIEFTERKARGLDIIFVLDTSKSMLATDLRPDRLERAKLAIRDIVKRLDSDRIGIVAFAGNAFLQTPPTLDYAAFRESLDSINPEIITRGGSDIGSALSEAANAFPQENNYKVCILLTDGEDLDGNAISTAEAIASEKIVVHTIGIGTPEGDYLRIRSSDGTEEFIRDAEGSPVRSQLDETTLQQISQITGGTYFRLSNQSLNNLYQSVLATLPRQEFSSEMQEVRIERFQWFIGAALFLSILEKLIRRRKQNALLLTLISITLLNPLQQSEAQTTPAQASTPAEAPPLPEDSRALYNLGVEQLTAGDYSSAKETFNQAIQETNDLQLQSDALYNQAHATNQLGEQALQNQDFEQAIQQWTDAEALFNSAHEINPQDTQASTDAGQLKSRRTALEEFLKQQEQQQQDQDPSEQGDQENNEEKSPDEDQSGDSENQQDQSGDSQNQEGQSGDQDQQQSESDSSEGEDSGQQNGDSPESSDSEEGEDDGSEGQQQTDEQGQPQDAQESTGNPADDLPQPGDEDAATEEEGAESTAPQEGESEELSEQSSAGTATEGAPDESGEESVSLREARALLNSLQQNERLLPFTPNQPNDGKNNRRDW